MISSIVKKIGQFILETIQVIVLALSIFIIVYLFLFQPHRVSGKSMYPNFDDGEFLLTNKISYRFAPPKDGDIVVFKAPKSEPCSEIDCEYIKRIIAQPGDKIMLSNGHYYLNGQLLQENYLPSKINTTEGSFLTEGVEKVVPEGYFFASGDNRTHSRDSREFGFVSETSIVGKAWLRYWPPSKIGIIKT